MSIRACNSDIVARGRAAFVAALIVVSSALCLASKANASGVIWIHLCGSWTPGANTVGGAIGVAHSGSSTSRISTAYQCPESSSASGMWVLGNQDGVTAGSRAYWEIDAPSGFAVISAHTEGSGMLSNGVNENWGWGGGFYWKGGGAKVTARPDVLRHPVHQLAVLRLANHLRRKHLQRVKPPRRGRGPWARAGGR